jgi:hypothetical protein
MGRWCFNARDGSKHTKALKDQRGLVVSQRRSQHRAARLHTRHLTMTQTLLSAPCGREDAAARNSARRADSGLLFCPKAGRVRKAIRGKRIASGACCLLSTVIGFHQKGASPILRRRIGNVRLPKTRPNHAIGCYGTCMTRSADTCDGMIGNCSLRRSSSAVQGCYRESRSNMQYGRAVVALPHVSRYWAIIGRTQKEPVLEFGGRERPMGPRSKMAWPSTTRCI